MGKLTHPLGVATAALVAAGAGLGIAHVARGASSLPPDAPAYSAFAPFDGSGESTNCPDAEGLERNKANVVGYYTTAFNDHDPVAAVEQYGGDEYIQHNPLADNGFDAFIGFVESIAGDFPDLNIDLVRVFAECDFVITHGIVSGAEPVFGELGNKVVDVFRLDPTGAIVEHWDVVAPISAESANGNPEV